MSELNAEQIKKALECCQTPSGIDCKDCGYSGKILDDGVDFGCVYRLMVDALALINELTVENERLKSVEFTCGFVKPHKVLECPIFDEIEKAKADTVRKFAERLKEGFRKYNRSNWAVREIIDEIAKEMLEGETR